jgi:hypothetical protein
MPRSWLDFGFSKRRLLQRAALLEGLPVLGKQAAPQPLQPVETRQARQLLTQKVCPRPLSPPEAKAIKRPHGQGQMAKLGKKMHLENGGYRAMAMPDKSLIWVLEYNPQAEPIMQ